MFENEGFGEGIVVDADRRGVLAFAVAAQGRGMVFDVWGDICDGDSRFERGRVGREAKNEGQDDGEKGGESFDRVRGGLEHGGVFP